MRRLLVITSLFVGVHFPSHSFASETPTIEIDVRPFKENSTDIFSILQILIKARQAYQGKDFETAASQYSVLVKYDPLMEEPIIGLAKSQLALQRPDLAENVLLKTSITTPEIEVLRAIAVAKNLPVAEAELHLVKVLKTSSDSRLWNLLGGVLSENGKWLEASNAYHAAEKLGQRPGLLFNNLGLLALQSGDLDKASQYLNRAVASSPETIRFDNNRRVILLHRGHYLNALKGLEDDRVLNLLTDAAFIASRQGDNVLAEHLFAKAIALNPKYDPKVHVRHEVTK